MRRRLGLAVGALTLAVAGAGYLAWRSQEPAGADPADAEQVALGARLYAAHCASCHGERLEGQPDWRVRMPNGKLPAPPHDETGHTWHHSDAQLFDIVKHGLEPYAPAGYRSDMPAYAEALTDREIWAVLAYIKSRWPPATRRAQERIDAAARGQRARQ